MGDTIILFIIFNSFSLLVGTIIGIVTTDNKWRSMTPQRRIKVKKVQLRKRRGR